MKIIEFSYKGINCIGFIEENEPDKINVIDYNKNLYFAIMECLNQNLSLREFILAKRSKNYFISAISQELTFQVPAKPKNDLQVIITGVGYTHKRKVATKYSVEVKPKQSEWFYKGNGSILRTTQATLQVPSIAQSVGEEAEMVLIYVIDNLGTPYRIGYTLGNDLSDPKLGRESPVYFSQSKLRECSIAPELIVDEIPTSLTGNVKIKRSNEIIWDEHFMTGTDNLIYSLDEIEHLIFQHGQFKLPGMLHYLFLGADKTSYSQEFQIVNGDAIEINSSCLSFKLINNIAVNANNSAVEIMNLL